MTATICFSTSTLLVLIMVSLILWSPVAAVLPSHERYIIGRSLQALDRYKAGEAEIQFAGTVVQLIFPMNDQVPDGSVSTQLFSDSDCSVDISGNDYLVPTIIYDDNPNPDGTKNRQVTIKYDIDPEGIQKSDVWVQDSNDQYFMNFCMSVQLHTGDAETTQVMGTLETVVRLKVDLVGDFGVAVDVMPNDPNSEYVLQKYFVDGYLCDDQLQEIIYMVPLVQGSKVRVCVKPTDDALADGVYMRSVDSFTYYRDNLATGNRINQVALKDGASANLQLTEHFCERGWEMCYFDTLLNADFYFKAGRVYGYGEAWLQYGTGSARKLQFEIKARTGARGLEEINGGFAGAAQFTLDFLVSPDAEFKFGAVAYECDKQNRKVKNPVPKRLGESIRVCVTPDEKSNEYGMTINHIDSWNWTRSETSSFQVAVEVGGAQAKDDLTILMCVEGSTLCIFRTQYTEDFYKKDGTVNGVGDVVLQFAPMDSEQFDEISISRRARRHLAGSGGMSRQLEGAVAGSALSRIAGTAKVKVDTPVANYRHDLPDECKYEQTVSGWWEEEPTNKKYTYIGIAAGVLTAIASSLLCCWLFPCLAKRDEEEETKIIKDGAGTIQVNVDIKSAKEESIISNHTSKTKSSKSLHYACDDTEVSGDSDGHRKRSSSKSRLAVPDGTEDGTLARNDVCFQDNSHPGTKKLARIIRRYQRDAPDESYGPHAYSIIKKDLGDINFFMMDAKRRCVQASKKEIRERIGEMFEQAKTGTLPRLEKARSLNDLESNVDDEEKQRSRRRSKSKIKRSGSAKSLNDLSLDDGDEEDRRSRKRSVSRVKRSGSSKSLRDLESGDEKPRSRRRSLRG